MADKNTLSLLKTTSDFSQFSDTSSIGDTRQLVEEKDDGQPKSGIYTASFNFINSIIGSGIIGIVKTFSKFFMCIEDTDSINLHHANFQSDVCDSPMSSINIKDLRELILFIFLYDPFLEFATILD
ncbi:hypothetical protein LOTGIDRAFT_174955 [Lottia gigantea]|uniref:Uncharacterized protein n=1 Tax=Lottia gigantea TaxID=225164 RepID=V4AR91_LOTGI|nr:hypothetical protein LOTGIDRAFT_174955 [Lottia gigantea]ESO96221.1 hypothetical protein LOTGIDRAFT_174955 [Lottia gigantea]